MKTITNHNVTKYELIDFELIMNVKGQLISELNFGVFKSPKETTKFWTDFCPGFILNGKPKYLVSNGI